ncbi:adenosine kinase [Cohaesibacter gelatinilyticus]|uniref:Sugar or nucleoside kinase, ribokinase family n=1 Tax=Cohaesibacter gelatinilyticus TaxID=372072 RepID=A0A285PF38_9HYPH|nr:adenosine kinase [Cohaesibacter gelatinilyticus]SNZ19913.1 Sugar or nucleoside kinase, ribokinase family [Cohaesibacter gelatinilyticus]
MSAPRFDILGIGNAIVDVLSKTEDDFLVKEGLHKGSMNLIDTERANYLYSKMGPAIEASGGSAGNTIFGIASLGGHPAYFGKVADDQLGQIFTHDMRSLGAHFETSPLVDAAPTARSMILITPDGERTMNTYLGACVELSEDDIDEEVVANSGITYMEGYLWDKENAKNAFRKAARIAHEAGHKVSISLSDSFCVDRFRSEFLELIQTGQVDIVFANEPEIKSLYQTSDRVTAINAIRRDAKLAAITLGEEGSLAVTAEETHHVNAHEIRELVDTTGAGDLYASGFLFGLANDLDLEKCALLGGYSAAEVIQHIGPRPAINLAQGAQQVGLL